MIHVQRDQANGQGNPVRPSERWFSRAEQATTNAILEKENHSALRSVYADGEVRVALERLFSAKCAYCESNLGSTSDWDVEHFRPKGGVAEREDHPGYYWLTYKWENLYPSCQHCNQRRKDQPLWDDPKSLPSGGKVDQFPLGDEETRALQPTDDIHAEDKLLLDPCNDEPEDHLGYDPTGRIFPLNKSHCGERTIAVLHLNRRRLRMRRRVALQYVFSLLKVSDSESTGKAAHQFKDLLDNLKSEASEFAGLNRYVARRPADFDL